MRANLLLLLCLTLLLSSCDFSSTFEDDYNFEEIGWHMDDQVSFTFETEADIQDISVKVRSDLNYPFYNLYLKAILKDSLGNPIKEKLLSFDLYDETSGKPLGKGNSIYQLNSLAFEKYAFPYDGKYQIELAQYMRKVELKGIKSVGVRVKKPE